MFSAGALFPLEVIKTNLQSITKKRNSTDDSSRKTEERAEERFQEEANRGRREEEGLGASADGSSGGTQEAKEGHDEEKRGLIPQQRQENEADPSVASVASDIYRREGISGFYKGVWYASGQSGVEKAAYFYGYGWLKALALRGGGNVGTATDLGLGYLAEAFHLPFTIPIEVRAVFSSRLELI